MLEKIKKLIQEHKLVGGIACGIFCGLLIALLFSGIGSLFNQGQIHVPQILIEDYMRLSIQAYSTDGNEALAVWRYKQLEPNAEKLLYYIKNDTFSDPLSIIEFAELISGNAPAFYASNDVPKEITAPQKAQPISSAWLVILLLAICGGGVAYGEVKTHFLTNFIKRFVNQNRNDENLMVDDLTQEYIDSEHETIQSEVDVISFIRDMEAEDDEYDLDEYASPDELSDLFKKSAKIYEDEEFSDGSTELKDFYDDSVLPVDPQRPVNVDMGMTSDYSNDTFGSAMEESGLRMEPEKDSALIINKTERTLANQTDDQPTMQFNAIYELGDDLFDKIFSIEIEEEFYGECGIGIAETLNNNSPHAVTAFEVWLFDRSDVHTPTKFLLSDFAMKHEPLVRKLRDKGEPFALAQGTVYEIETRSMRMQVKPTLAVYGEKTPEPDSYFEKCEFEISVWVLDTAPADAS